MTYKIHGDLTTNEPLRCFTLCVNWLLGTEQSVDQRLVAFRQMCQLQTQHVVPTVGRSATQRRRHRTKTYILHTYIHTTM